MKLIDILYKANFKKCELKRQIQIILISENIKEEY